MIAYAKEIGADGYGYVTSEEAAADAVAFPGVVAAKVTQATADVKAQASVVVGQVTDVVGQVTDNLTKVTADAKVQVAAATSQVVAKVDTLKAKATEHAQLITDLLTAYYAQHRLQFAQSNPDLNEKLTEAAQIFYGHVARLAESPYAAQILEFLQRKTGYPGAGAADGDETTAITEVEVEVDQPAVEEVAVADPPSVEGGDDDDVPEAELVEPTVVVEAPAQPARPESPKVYSQWVMGDEQVENKDDDEAISSM